MYVDRIEPRFRNRAPKMERRKTPTGREYDAWMLEGQQVGTLGAVMQAGQRFEDPSQIDFLGVWEDVRKGAYTADAMLTENEEDGIWGSVLQPSQGLFWYRVPDTELLSEICRCYNDWIADFCKPHSKRLKGIAMLNVDDPDAGAKELERVAKMGLVGSFIPVSPLPDKPCTQPDLRRSSTGDRGGTGERPLLMRHRHAAQRRPGERVHHGRDRADRGGALDRRGHWVRLFPLGSMLFAGDVFDKFPGLKIGSIELRGVYGSPATSRGADGLHLLSSRPVFTEAGGRSKELMPSDCWKKNMFVEFMERTISACSCTQAISASRTCCGAATTRMPRRPSRARSSSSSACSRASPRPTCRRSPRRTRQRCSSSS